ncbi:hypothetical protein DY000_02012190 [Brassica cretica]|uniref:Uncharacterized protein n=1 Tax=Brassica cretica TaxID=69181 RepID=A0ABQ7DB48_BRACR|nr:hypothetical protein DY000_02012190 [Brassica cretica]
MDKTEERRRHGGANQISLGGAQQGFKYSRCERAKRKRERQKGTRERVRDRVRSLPYSQKETRGRVCRQER